MKYQYDILQKHDEICKEYTFPDKKLNELKKKINSIKKEILKLETVIKVNNVNNTDINLELSKIHKMKLEISELQNDRDLFDKYRESIHLIKNKAFIEMYDKTECLIEMSNYSDNDFYPSENENNN